MSQRLLIFTIFYLLSTNAQAAATHLFWIPQALTLETNEIAFDLQNQFTADKSATTPFHRSLWGASMGLVNWGRFKFEAGLDWREPTAVSIASAISAHGRLVFNNVQEDGWAVGIGVDQFGFHAGVNDLNLNHVVFQNLLGEEWEMAFGGYAGNSTYLRGDDKGMFLGLWRRIQNDRGQAGVEWTSGNSELGYLVPGLKVEIRDGVMGYLAYGAANRRNVLKDWILMRISVLF
jgi:hypothetical protein